MKERIEERIERRKQASFSQLTTTINQSMIQIHSIHHKHLSINQSKKEGWWCNQQTINQSQIKVNWNWFGWLVGWLVVEIKRHLSLLSFNLQFHCAIQKSIKITQITKWVKQTNKQTKMTLSIHLIWISINQLINQWNQMKQTTNNSLFQINQSITKVNEWKKEKKK